MTTTIATAGAANGTVPHEPVFPVDSFREAAPHLRRPFTPEAVKFKVQATWNTGGLIVAYIDARLVVERLNLIVPHLWHDAYRPVGSGQMWCDLTVDHITRSDIGEGAGKGLVSDALKRAGVKFGIGVSLYATPTLMLNNQHLKRKPGPNGKEQVTINDDGMRVVRSAYSAWLDQHGRESFGEPLSHGDVEGAQGDPEADAPIPANVDALTGEVTPQDAPQANAVDVEQAARVVAKLKQLVDTKTWTAKDVKLNLAAAGATDTSTVPRAVETLQAKQAKQLEQHIDQLIAKQQEA